MLKYFVKFFFVIYLIKVSLACQGHTLKVNYIRTCSQNNVVKIQENSTAKLTRDCEIIPTACGQTTGFNTAKVHYEVFKNNLSIDKGDFDGCKKLEEANPEYKEMIKLFGLPTNCPVGKINKCESDSKKIDVKKHKNIFNLARGAPIRTHVLIQHDNGQSCFESEIEIKKKM
ncbi:hypothetical protein PVAND_010478 [Polypedilum vanderplanki]|uniref:Uncharacterized protein n=1 Tax=Polypedilum vanderplanki TaxID=319348 RepID=A0A9J6CGV1_POLVA|nr:hypothetical protein PVAND_010478 [Polypedilum vanderplanki]